MTTDSAPQSASLETARLLIRPLLESDLAAVFACYDHPEVGRYCAPVRWPDMDHALNWFNRRAGDSAAGVIKQYVIVLKESGNIIGTCVLFRIDTIHGGAEIGYALGRDFWGAGYAAEAITALIDHAFNAIHLHRLNAVVDPRNLASAKVLLKFGFQHEGTLRESYLDAGEYTDSALYGLLVNEWQNSPVGADHTPS